MAEYVIKINGGTVVDGTRTPRYVSDIAIEDGKIVQICGVRSSRAAKVLALKNHPRDPNARPYGPKMGDIVSEGQRQTPCRGAMPPLHAPVSSVC